MGKRAGKKKSNPAGSAKKSPVVTPEAGHPINREAHHDKAIGDPPPCFNPDPCPDIANPQSALTDIEILSQVITRSHSALALRKVAVTSKDFKQGAIQARPAVLRHLARAGRQTAERIIADIMELNPGTQRADRPTFVQDPNHDMYGSMLDWDMSDLDLEVLPDSLGCVSILGTLDLSKNKLRTIPRSFGNLVCGSLDLSTNFLERIPDTFHRIKVTRDLSLHENDFLHADSLPESFGSLVIGDWTVY